MIDSAVTQRQVRAYAEVLEIDLALLFKALRADVMDALKQDDPLNALEKVFDTFSPDGADTPGGLHPGRLDLLKSAERDLILLVKKARTKSGKGGILVLGDDGHWRLQDKQESEEKAKRPDFHIKKDIQLTKGFSIKKGTQMTGVKVMASGNKIRQVGDLIDKYPLQNGKLTKSEDWEKVRGTSLITNGKTIFKAEIHWYQCKNIGKVQFKRKERNDE
jgi:hypothetical protein